MRITGIVIGILGIWLIIAGIIGLGQPGNFWNGWIVGILVAILGFAIVGREGAEGIVIGILGLRVLAIAFIPALNTAAVARWEDIVVGIILAIIGFVISRRAVTSTTSDIRRAA